MIIFQVAFAFIFWLMIAQRSKTMKLEIKIMKIGALFECYYKCSVISLNDELKFMCESVMYKQAIVCQNTIQQNLNLFTETNTKNHQKDD